jgi:hypothetical protein
MVIEMLSLSVFPAILPAVAPLVIISAKNPNSFNELRIIDRSPWYHDVGLALGDLHR